jgi:hypothetical protein
MHRELFWGATSYPAFAIVHAVVGKGAVRASSSATIFQMHREE